MNILNLPGWELTGTEQEGTNRLHRAKYTLPPTGCPACGILNEPGKLYRWSAKEQDFHDTPLLGKRITIRVNRQRWRCRECGATFMQPLPGLNDDHRMTERLADYIPQQALERTYTSLAMELGLDEKTIRNVFNAYSERLREAFVVETPTSLGIEELPLLGKPRAVFTNLQEHTIVDVVEKRDKKTVADYLYRMPNRHSVELACINMWTPYRDAVRDCLPQAQVIVDKHYVMRLATDALETVRKECHKGLSAGQRATLKDDRTILQMRRKHLTDTDHLKLEAWTSQFPRLVAAYEAKEAVYDLFDADLTSAVAITRYEAWKDTLDPDTRLAFNDLIQAVTKWHPEVFAYFDHRITNAFTEAHTAIEWVVNRLGRGYSFEAHRVKMLLRLPRKPKNPQITEHGKVPESTPLQGESIAIGDLTLDVYVRLPSVPVRDYGVSIGGLLSRDFERFLEQIRPLEKWHEHLEEPDLHNTLRGS